jgi:hypothetical protein
VEPTTTEPATEGTATGTRTSAVTSQPAVDRLSAAVPGVPVLLQVVALMGLAALALARRVR